jgi:hypothetical protein
MIDPHDAPLSLTGDQPPMAAFCQFALIFSRPCSRKRQPACDADFIGMTVLTRYDASS